jgi:hypothetical protein
MKKTRFGPKVIKQDILLFDALRYSVIYMFRRPAFDCTRFPWRYEWVKQHKFKELPVEPRFKGEDQLLMQNARKRHKLTHNRGPELDGYDDGRLCCWRCKICTKKYSPERMRMSWTFCSFTAQACSRCVSPDLFAQPTIMTFVKRAR